MNGYRSVADDIDDLVAQNKILTKALKRIIGTYRMGYKTATFMGRKYPIDYEMTAIGMRKIARDAIREVEKMKDEKG